MGCLHLSRTPDPILSLERHQKGEDSPGQEPSHRGPVCKFSDPVSHKAGPRPPPQECEERGASIVYATHIFDGLEGWPTHLAYMEGGKVVKGGLWAGIHELEGGQRLLATVEQWLLKEKKERRAAMAAGGCKQDALTTAAKQPAPMMPSRHMAYFR